MCEKTEERGGGVKLYPAAPRLRFVDVWTLLSHKRCGLADKKVGHSFFIVRLELVFQYLNYQVLLRSMVEGI